jgi:hypothetical protein
VSYCHVSITRDNHLQELGSRLQPHALLLNLAVGVSSLSLIIEISVIHDITTA